MGSGHIPISGPLQRKGLVPELEKYLDPAFTLLTDNTQISNTGQYSSVHFKLQAPKEPKDSGFVWNWGPYMPGTKL